MAISLTATVIAEGTAHLVGMPPVVAAGDLLVCNFASATGSTVTTPSGWVNLDSVSQGPNIRLSNYYRIADGTEDGTTVDFVTSHLAKAVAYVYRVPLGEWHGTTPPEVGTAAVAAGSTTPDPPPVTPSWGAEANTIFFAVCAESNVRTVTTYPTNYTDGADDANPAGGSTQASIGSARRVNTAATENPGVFTVNLSSNWVAQTVAVRPATGMVNAAIVQALPTITQAVSTGLLVLVDIGGEGEIETDTEDDGQQLPAVTQSATIVTAAQGHTREVSDSLGLVDDGEWSAVGPDTLGLTDSIVVVLSDAALEALIGQLLPAITQQAATTVSVPVDGNTVVLSDLWVHLASDLDTFVQMYAGAIADETTVGGEVRRYANGVFRAITVPGTAREVRVDLPFLDRDDLETLESWTGIPVMVRDPLGRKVFGVFFSLDTSEQPLGDVDTVLRSGFSLFALSLSEEV